MKEEKRTAAVVLAGGFGTRLSPLTSTKPKPLVKILDTTVLEGVLYSIRLTDCQKVFVSTCYMHELICEKTMTVDKSIACVKEEIPLGTAGGVRNCVGDAFDEVLVVSGDAVFDFDLQEAIDYHRQTNACVTIVTSSKQNPTSFGVVECDDKGNVELFWEKPSWKNVRSDSVNTGIYVLSKKALSKIPKDCFFDFSKDLFPLLLKEKEIINCISQEGFWCDIGTLDELYNCNVLASEKGIGSFYNTGVDTKKLCAMGVSAKKGVYVSKSAYIGRNVSLDTGTVVCANAEICNDCDISASIVGGESVVGRGSSINGAIIGESVKIGENCIVNEGCVIADGCSVADGCVLEKGTRLDAGERVNTEEKKKMGFDNAKNIFVDDGTVLLDKEGFDTLVSLCESMVNALSEGINKKMCIAVMSEGDLQTYKAPIITCLMMCGCNVFDCGEGHELCARYVCRSMPVDAVLLVSMLGEKICIKIFESGVQVLSDEKERKLVKSMSEHKPSLRKAVRGDGKLINIPAEEIYRTFLLSFLSECDRADTLRKKTFAISESEKQSSKPLELLWKCLSEYGVKSAPPSKNLIKLSISPDASTCECVYNKNVTDMFHMGADVLENARELCIHEVVLPKNSPDAYKTAASRSEINMVGCREAAPNAFVLDDCCMLLLAYAVLSSLYEGKEKETVQKTPSFSVYTDEFFADSNRAHTMKRLSELYCLGKEDDGDGIKLTLSSGTVRVIPGRIRGFKIISEAVSMEAAKEIAVKIGKVIKQE